MPKTPPFTVLVQKYLDAPPKECGKRKKDVEMEETAWKTALELKIREEAETFLTNVFATPTKQ